MGKRSGLGVNRRNKFWSKGHKGREGWSVGAQRKKGCSMKTQEKEELYPGVT